MVPMRTSLMRYRQLKICWFCFVKKVTSKDREEGRYEEVFHSYKYMKRWHNKLNMRRKK